MIGRRVVRWIGHGVVYWKIVGIRRRPSMVLWLLGLHRRPSDVHEVWRSGLVSSNGRRAGEEGCNRFIWKLSSQRYNYEKEASHVYQVDKHGRHVETSLYYMKLNDEKRENEGHHPRDDRDVGSKANYEDYVVVRPVATAIGLYHIHAASGPPKEPVRPVVELHHKKKWCVGCWAVRVGLADCIGPDEWSGSQKGVKKPNAYFYSTGKSRQLPLLFDWLDAKRTVGDDELLEKSVEEPESLLHDDSFRSNMKVVVVVVVVCLPRPWMPNGDIGGGRVRLDVGSGEKRGGGRKIKEIFKERKALIPY
ncbi:hypothetical protein Tco_0839533 [Tanacetum coccineum]|uniref:Uncharacterized protein n=1 Tax=Tanacetum coccineum TaxID=301880 RepID=A0ABQ5AVJ3_9ASTR